MSGLSPGQIQALTQQMQIAAPQATVSPSEAKALAQEPPVNEQQPSDPSIGGGELEIWNPFGKNFDLGVHTPQAIDRTLAGAGQGMTNVVRHVGNLLGGIGGTTDADLARDKATDAPLLNTTAGKVGNFLGTTAITAPLMLGAGEGALQAGGLLGRLAGTTLGKGAIEGAAQGFATADPGQRLQGTLTGGVLGGALPGIGKVGGKFVRGFARSPEAQELLDRGVDLTPGLLNPTGQRNASEEAAQSLPFIGAAIARARGGALKGFQRTAIGEGAAPGAQISGNDANDMLASAYNSFSPLYDQAKGFKIVAKGGSPVIMKTAGADVPLDKAFQQAVTDKGVMATVPERRMVKDFLTNEATRFNGTSDSLLDMRSNIRAQIRQLKLDGKTPQADLLKNAEGGITQVLESQLPKDAQTALQTADSKYGTYKILEDAVARSKDRPTGMTATNLSEAVKNATPQGVYARGGGGPLRDLARAGKEVFDVRSPPTGARVETMLPAAAAAYAHPLVAAPLALARLGLTVTRPGRMLAAGQAPLQKALASRLASAQLAAPALLPTLGRYARAGLGSYALPMLQQQP